MKKFAAMAYLVFVAASAAAAADPAAPVRVYDAGEMTLDRYTVIKRLWTGTLRASFWVPAYGDAGSAISALTEAAGRLGADGVVNLHCLNDSSSWGGGYTCYGLAIRLKQ